MTRTRKHKSHKQTCGCNCQWCNPAKARSEHLKKRAKKDFNASVILVENFLKKVGFKKEYLTEEIRKENEMWDMVD